MLPAAREWAHGGRVDAQGQGGARREPAAHTLSTVQAGEYSLHVRSSLLAPIPHDLSRALKRNPSASECRVRVAGGLVGMVVE